MKLFFVGRYPCHLQGVMCEPIGVALTEEAAIAMCSDPCDVVALIDADRMYPPGEPCDVPQLLPSCPNMKAKGWMTAQRGLSGAG